MYVVCYMCIHRGVGLIYKSENISGKPFRNAHVTGSSDSRICAYIVHIIILQQPGICRINVLGAIPADSAMRNSCIRRPCIQGIYTHSEGVKSATVSLPRPGRTTSAEVQNYNTTIVYYI